MKRKTQVACAWLFIAIALSVSVYSLLHYRQRGVEVLRKSSSETLGMLACSRRDAVMAYLKDMSVDADTLKLAADSGVGADELNIEAKSLGFDSVDFSMDDLYPIPRFVNGNLEITRQTSLGLMTLTILKDKLGDVFDSPEHENRYFSFIADSDGEILSPVNHEDYLSITNNTLKFYSESVLHDGASVEAVAQAIKNNEGGYLSYSYGSRSGNVSWEPLGINNWSLFLVTDSGLTTAAQDDIDKRVWELATTLAIGLIALLIAFHMLNGLLRDDCERSERQYLVANAKSEALSAISFTILFDCDLKTGEITYNESFERQLGRKPSITNLSMLLSDDADPALNTMALEMKRGVPKGKASVQIHHANGAPIWYQIYYICVYGLNKTKPERVVGRIANIEWHEHEQDTQTAIVECDALTGLLGHTAFMRRCEGTLASHRDDCALMIIDIDDFKIVSQSRDMYQGDELIVRMSDAIRQAFPSGALTGRISGDVFAVMVPHAPSKDFLSTKAGILEREFAKTGCTCSIGIVQSDETVTSIAELCARADKALYRAKLLGKHGYQFFDANSENDAIDEDDSDISALLLKCVMTLNTAKTLDEGLEFALKETARYYDASCAYVLTRDREKNRLYETGIYRREAKQAEALEIDCADAPELMKSLKSHKPLSVYDSEIQDDIPQMELAIIRRRGERSVFLMPLGENGDELGFLGIASPKYHVGSVTFLKTLATCLGCDILKRRDKTVQE